MKTRERVDLDLVDDNPWQPRQEGEAPVMQVPN